jgi:hypothetical protein
VVLGLSAVPASISYQAAGGASTGLSSAHCQVFTYSCGHSWSFALLFGQFFIHSDGGGQVHQVGGSFSPPRNYRRRLCITSDRRVQFTSAFWAAVMVRLGIKHIMTTAFHPQSNGAVERFHCRLKDSLRARLAGAEWPQHLPWVMLGLRAAPREDSGVSAAELVYGAPLTLPGPLIAAPEQFVQQLRAGVPCVAPLPQQPGGGGSPSPSLQAAEFVYVRAPLALTPLYPGPFRVHKQTDKFFIIKVGGKFDAVSVDRLKPHLGGPVMPADPPRHSRPPLSSARRGSAGSYCSRHWGGGGGGSLSGHPPPSPPSPSPLRDN